MKTQLKSTYKNKYLKSDSQSRPQGTNFGAQKPKPKSMFGSDSKPKTTSGNRFDSKSIPGNRFDSNNRNSNSGSRAGYGNSGSRFGFKKVNNFSKTKKVFREEKIDVSRFIQKCSEATKEEAYIPKNCFADFDIDQRLKSNIAKKGYVDPTPIQDQIIPITVTGKDVVGIANTGTGKTAAFLIPAINKCLKTKNKTIVIVPTRELALQIDDEFRGFAAGLKLYSVLCIGGTSVGKQIFSLKRSHDFIFGTPGRIKDMAQRKHLNLSAFNTIVLDEVDRMLDMGFIDDITHIVGQVSSERQNMFFSATMPVKMEGLVNKFLKDPVKISVKKQEFSSNVNQNIVRVGGGKKFNILCDLLKKDEFEKVLVFAKTKNGVERLSDDLINSGFKADSIHGDKRQSKREKALNRFKTNQVKILVTTDVAARGLDINDITHVINYDLPATYDDYVHKIGRTGRGNKKGEALTFVN